MLKQAVNITEDAGCDEKSFLEHMNETYQYFCAGFGRVVARPGRDTASTELANQSMLMPPCFLLLEKR
jgi:hypothetical protein